MSLRDYLTILRRRKWLVIVVVMAVTVIAVVYSLRQADSYSADAEVLLSRQDVTEALSGAPPTSSSSSDVARDAQTQAELARVPPVAEATVAAAGVPTTVEAFLDNSSVTSSPNSDLLTFQAEYGTSRGAVQLVNAYAREFARYRQELDTASLTRARSAVVARMDELAAAGEGTSALYRQLASKREELRVLLALQTSHAVVVRTATSATQVQPKPVRNAIVAAVLALLLGVGLAFLRDALDTRTRSALEIAEHLKLPLLARLPEPPPKLLKQNKLVMLEEPGGAAAEPFRVLRANLDLVSIDREIPAIMVASAVQEEGKSTTVANLAVTTARAGRRVVLLDLDLRRGDVDHLFGVAGQPGVTDVALGTVSLEEALVPIDVDPEGDASFMPSQFARTARERAASLQRAVKELRDGRAEQEQVTRELVETEAHAAGGQRPAVDLVGRASQRLEEVEALADRAERAARRAAATAEVDERAGTLQILAAGNRPPNPGDFVLSDTVADILKRLSDAADLILVDAPPFLQTGDAMAISALVDGVVIVTRLGVRRSTLDELGLSLDRLVASKLGVVVTGDSLEQGYYAGYASKPARDDADDRTAAPGQSDS